MNILLVGKSGLGKSNLGDIVRNSIFKADSNACISTDDPDRTVKTLGQGTNSYLLKVRREALPEDLEQADIVVTVNTSKFKELFKEIERR